VWTTAEASGNLLANKLKTLGGEELMVELQAANNYSHNRIQDCTVEISGDRSLPCYIYQLRTDVPLETGATATLWGGHFKSDRMLDLIECRVLFIQSTSLQEPGVGQPSG
jgi:hypothetical protein